MYKDQPNEAAETFDILKNNQNNNDEFSFVSSVDDIITAPFEKLILNRINDKIKKDDLKIKYKKLSYVYEKSINETENDGYRKIMEKLKSLSNEFYIEDKTIYLIFDNSIIRCIVLSFKDFIKICVLILCNTFNEIDEADESFSKIFPKTDTQLVSIECFSIDSNQRTISYNVDEKINETFYPESYPFIMNSNIKDFVINFVKSDENVLILLGPPGTGKTKFIRYLLRECQDYYLNYQNEEASVKYTNNSKVMDLNDQLFVNFISSENTILVLEDIDFHLSDRKGGNSLMYKLLGSSDGLITTKNKIIISTNIDSESRIDEALIRPGRCFDLVRFRKLNTKESNKLLKKLDSKYKLSEDNYYSLSEIYRFSKTGKISGSSESTDKHRKGTGFV